jgi:hypothetical protein
VTALLNYLNNPSRVIDKVNMFQNYQKHRARYYLSFVIVVATIILTRGIHRGEFWFPDASRHAMDGVFLLDFAKDFPIFHIIDYTTQYYTKYPALAIGYYPPFFAFVEAGFFALFGISVVSARLTVLFFALIALIFWFKLIEQIFNEKIALYSSILFITTPFVVKWAKSTMLEMPALAMVILSIYFFYNFIELNKPRHGWYTLLAVCAAIYTKQTSVFILVTFFLYFIFTRRFRRMISKDVILLSFGLCLLIFPLAFFTLRYGQMNLAQSIGSVSSQSRLLFLKPWLFYPRALFKVLTIPMLTLSFFSISLIILKRDHRKLILFLAWVLGFYLTFSYLGVKSTRYIYFWLPPYALFAALILNETLWRIKKVPVASVILILLCAYQFMLSGRTRIPLVQGYEAAAQYILNKGEGRVFFQGSGVGNGNFIFDIRKLDQGRRMVVFRGDKILASSSVSAHYLLKEHVKNIDDTYALLEAYGPRYFVIEEHSDFNIKAFKMLRQVLESDVFTLDKEIELYNEDTRDKNQRLLIYRLNKDIPAAREEIHIRLPIIGSEICVSLKNLSNFYTPSEKKITLDRDDVGKNG